MQRGVAVGDLRPVYRLPLLIVAVIALVVGVLAGISRFGMAVPDFALQQMANHGVLMVPVFLGTVIGLERAVATGELWAYAAPLLSGLGGGLLLYGGKPADALLVISLGSLVFLVSSIRVLRIQNRLHHWVMLGGAAALVVGNTLLLTGTGIGEVVGWWIVFLLLTIVGERLELSRLVIAGRARQYGLVLVLLVLAVGVVAEHFEPFIAKHFLAAGMIGAAAWLLRFDVARHTVRVAGLPRFAAVCMIAGYLWLMLSGVLFVAMEHAFWGVGRDLPLHTFFLGFVFSMIVGHALIVFPAVTRVTIPFTPLFYIPALLLQVSLLVRVAGGVIQAPVVAGYGGLTNGIAIALLFLTLISHLLYPRLASLWR